jgi:Zn-dependent protease with chaperone function
MWRFFALAILCGGWFQTPFFAAEKQGQETETAQALRGFASRYRTTGVGVLLTPTRGKLSPRLEETVGFLRTVLANIGADRIKQKKIHVQVNIYSSWAPSAFANLPKCMGQSPSWTIHRLLGFSDDGLPVYEIGLHQGIFRYLTTEDRVAALLAHELKHIL